MPEHTHEVTVSGRVVVWAFRHWFRARAQTRDIPNYVLRTLHGLPGGRETATRLEALFALLALGAKRRLSIRAPEASALSGDERDLLLALHACSLGLEDEARNLLVAHQSAGGIRASQTALEIAAQSIRRPLLRFDAFDAHRKLDAVITKDPRPDQTAPTPRMLRVHQY